MYANNVLYVSSDNALDVLSELSNVKLSKLLTLQNGGFNSRNIHIAPEHLSRVINELNDDGMVYDSSYDTHYTITLVLDHNSELLASFYGVENDNLYFYNCENIKTLHTCTCGDSLSTWQGGYVPDTTKFVYCDLSQINDKRESSPMVWYVTQCSKCNGDVLHSHSVGGYSAVGKYLLGTVLKDIKRETNSERHQYCKKLNPSTDHIIDCTKCPNYGYCTGAINPMLKLQNIDIVKLQDGGILNNDGTISPVYKI